MTTYTGPAGGTVWPEPVGVGIDVVPVPEPKTTAKNRVHLDLASTSAAHQADLAPRTEAVEAQAVAVGDLLRLGAEAEVLGPPELREAMAQTVAELVSRYAASP